MANLEKPAQIATIVGAALAGVCTLATVAALWLTWEMYIKDSPPPHGGYLMAHPWLWTSLVFLVLLIFGSFAMNATAWRLQHKARKEKLEVKRLQDALHESAKSNLEYRAERDIAVQNKVAAEHQFNGLFTPLQIEAFRLSGEISGLLKSLPKPSVDGSRLKDTFDSVWEEGRDTESTQWIIRLTSAYASDIAPRLKSVLNGFGRSGYRDAYLDQFKEAITKDDDLRFIQARLICLAHDVNGVGLRERV